MSNQSDCLYCGGHKAHHKADVAHCVKCWTCDDCQMHGCDLDYNELHHSNVKPPKGSMQKGNGGYFRDNPYSSGPWKQSTRRGGNTSSISNVNVVPPPTKSLWENVKLDLDGDHDKPVRSQTAETNTPALTTSADYRSWRASHGELFENNDPQVPALSPFEQMKAQQVEQIKAQQDKIIERKLSATSKPGDPNVLTIQDSISPIGEPTITKEGHSVCIYRIKVPSDHEMLPTTLNGKIMVKGKELYYFYVHNSELEISISCNMLAQPKGSRPIVGKVQSMDEQDFALVIAWTEDNPPNHGISISYDVTVIHKKKSSKKKLSKEAISWAVVFGDNKKIFVKGSSITDAMHEGMRAIGPIEASQITNIYQLT